MEVRRGDPTCFSKSGRSVPTQGTPRSVRVLAGLMYAEIEEGFLLAHTCFIDFRFQVKGIVKKGDKTVQK